MRIMKLSDHQINILNVKYTLILFVIENKSYFNEFCVYYTSYSNFSTWGGHRSSMWSSF